MFASSFKIHAGLVVEKRPDGFRNSPNKIHAKATAFIVFCNSWPQVL